MPHIISIIYVGNIGMIPFLYKTDAENHFLIIFLLYAFIVLTSTLVPGIDDFETCEYYSLCKFYIFIFDTLILIFTLVFVYR